MGIPPKHPKTVTCQWENLWLWGAHSLGNLRMASDFLNN